MFSLFSNYFNLIKLQLKVSTTATLGTSKKVAIVERLKEEWMYVMYGPSAEKKKNKTKMVRVERWPLRKKHLILTEINEAILLSIEGYCVCRDRYAVLRKLPHSRKLYLCMNSASRIFFSASFLSVYEVVRTTKKKIWVVGLFTSHTNIEHQMSDQKNYAS